MDHQTDRANEHSDLLIETQIVTAFYKCMESIFQGRFIHDTQDNGVSRNNPTQHENHPQVLRTR